MRRMTDAPHIARRGLQLALGAALILYGIAGFPSPVTQPQQAAAQFSASISCHYVTHPARTPAAAAPCVHQLKQSSWL